MVRSGNGVGYARGTMVSTAENTRETFGGNSKAGLGRHTGMTQFVRLAIINGASGHPAPSYAANSYRFAFNAGKLSSPYYPVSFTNQLTGVGAPLSRYGPTRAPADGVNVNERLKMQEAVNRWNLLWPAQPVRSKLPAVTAPSGYSLSGVPVESGGVSQAAKRLASA